MSALENLKKNIGVAPVNESLKSDLNTRGTTQPVIAPKTGSAIGNLRANIGARTTPVTPVTETPPEKSAWGSYADQVNRKVASFDAGFIQSVGQLSRSFQWLGDRLVGDRSVQNASDKVLESELKATDDMLKIYRDRKARGDMEGAKVILDQLNVMSKNGVKYEAYADTTDSVFYKAQDKTQAWADTLKASAGITPENSTFSDRLFEGAGSSATYFVPSLGVFKGAKVLSAVSPRLAMLFAGSAGAGLEAMAEAGSTFDEWKKKGDLQKAGEESTKVFFANAILLAVTNQLGVFNPAKLGILKRALLSAPTEGLQEAVQQVIQNEANDRPLWEGVLEAGTIGAIVGSVMGGVTDVVTTQTKESEEGYNGAKPTADTSSPAIMALREKLKVTPAIEQQRAIEGTSVPTPKVETPAPVTEKKPVTPVVKPTGKIPSYAEAGELINQEGGFSKASSLPATNRMDAEQLGESLSFNPQFLYTQATKEGVRLRDFLMRLDSETDPVKRTEIGAELMETLSKPDEVKVEEVNEKEKKKLDKEYESQVNALANRSTMDDMAFGKFESERAKITKNIYGEGKLREEIQTLTEEIENIKGEPTYDSDETAQRMVKAREQSIKIRKKELGEKETSQKMKEGEKPPKETTEVKKPEPTQTLTSQEVADKYWDEVIAPAIEKGEVVVIGADDLKDHFGKDYNDANHPIYSKGAFMLYERALKEAEGDVVFTGGGAGSGKTEILVQTLIEGGYTGIIYDSNMANLEGIKKQIAMAEAEGKRVEIYGITPNLESARRFTIIRENEKGRGISDNTFARGHAGFPKVVEGLLSGKIIPKNKVNIVDTRGQVSKEEAIEMVRNGTFVKNPLDYVKKLGYTENYVKENYSKDSYSRTGEERLQGKEVQRPIGETPRKSRADKEVKDTSKKSKKAKVSEPTPQSKEGKGTKNASVGKYREEKKFRTTYNVNDPIDLENLGRTFNEETASKMKEGIFEYGRYKTKEELENLISANIVSEPYTPMKLKEKAYKGTRTFYHGTSSENVEKIREEGFTIGSELPEDAFRGGGYGRMQDSVSLTTDVDMASRFIGTGSQGAVMKVEVTPNANIISVTNIEDATDLNDYVPELLDRGVDAVWIGGGENELVVINPKVLNVTDSRDFSAISAKEDLAGFGTEVQEEVKQGEGGGQAGGGFASIGKYRDDTEIFLRNPDAIKPIEFPELVALANELSGNVPFLRKYKKSNGMFYPRGDGEIGLNPELFERKNLGQLTKTLAHEIGHLVDYLPDHTMARGNLMGRLNTLRGFMKEFYAPAGASRTDSELREQMYALSVYWRPYDEKTASPSFIAYRKSAPEVYADFISALFNDPRMVSDKAPTAYNIFFEQLDNKPNVKEAYFELQELLRTGDIVASRRTATTEMFKITEQESKERQIQNQVEQEMREKSIWFKFKTQAVDITEIVREKVKEAEARGERINPDDNPTYYLEERNYLGGKIKSEVDTKFNTIYQELQENDLTWEDLGELMMYERILKGDRQEIANPLGYQPDFVQELMEVYEDVGTVKADADAHAKSASDMKTTLGDERYALLQRLAEKYRENLKGFFREGYTEGIYSEELNQLFTENSFYVPFKGAKYSGVTRTSFGVKQQKGTLGNIENPANTGIEKAVSIIRAIERNKVTRKTIEFFQEYHADEVIVAPTDKNGYPMNPREENLALVTYMEDGKVKGFHVDKYIADAIQKNTVAQQNLLIGSLRFWNSRLFRPLFITFNLGFQTFNLIRDMKRFWKNVPNMTLLKTLRLYSQSVRASRIRGFGLPKNPSQADIEAYDLINKLENEQVISITYNDIIKGENIEDAQIERILREVGVREAEQTKLGTLATRAGLSKNTPLIKQAFGIMDFIEKLGNTIETLPKVAGVMALEGTMNPREMRSFVRRYVGSPDFMAGGQFKPYMNEVFLFSNAIFQGIRSDYEIATKPTTRGAYWLKTAQSELLPKMLMLMATYGLFGEYLKELFGKVGEYDKTNYTVIPLGLDENGKTIYFRMPSDETGRLIGGAFWKMASSIAEPEKLAELQTYTDLLAYAGGQVPSVTPVATAGFNIMQFVAGENPYDFFRQRPVLTDDQQEAGGVERAKPFLTYMFQQLGGNVFVKLYQNETVPKNPSLSEKIASLPVVGNIAGRFIKASNYGETERIREVTDEVKQQQARERLANRRVVFDYVEQAKGLSYAEAQAIKKQMVQEIYGGYPKTPEDRRQAQNLEKRFDTLRIRGTADARVDSLVVAQSNEEKVALLKQFKTEMSPEEYNELKKFIITNRVVSSAVFQALYRVEK